MNAINKVATALIIGGILGMMYGSFNYSREMQKAKISSIGQSVKNTQTAYISIWGSVAAVITGVGLLFFANKKVNS